MNDNDYNHQIISDMDTRSINADAAKGQKGPSWSSGQQMERISLNFDTDLMKLTHLNFIDFMKKFRKRTSLADLISYVNTKKDKLQSNISRIINENLLDLLDSYRYCIDKGLNTTSLNLIMNKQNLLSLKENFNENLLVPINESYDYFGSLVEEYKICQVMQFIFELFYLIYKKFRSSVNFFFRSIIQQPYRVYYINQKGEKIEFLDIDISTGRVFSIDNIRSKEIIEKFHQESRNRVGKGSSYDTVIIQIPSKDHDNTENKYSHLGIVVSNLKESLLSYFLLNQSTFYDAVQRFVVSRNKCESGPHTTQVSTLTNIHDSSYGTLNLVGQKNDVMNVGNHSNSMDHQCLLIHVQLNPFVNTETTDSNKTGNCDYYHSLSNFFSWGYSDSVTIHNGIDISSRNDANKMMNSVDQIHLLYDGFTDELRILEETLSSASRYKDLFVYLTMFIQNLYSCAQTDKVNLFKQKPTTKVDDNDQGNFPNIHNNDLLESKFFDSNSALINSLRMEMTTNDGESYQWDHIPSLSKDLISFDNLAEGIITLKLIFIEKLKFDLSHILMIIRRSVISSQDSSTSPEKVVVDGNNNSKLTRANNFISSLSVISGCLFKLESYSIFTRFFRDYYISPIILQKVKEVKSTCPNSVKDLSSVARNNSMAYRAFVEFVEVELLSEDCFFFRLIKSINIKLETSIPKFPDFVSTVLGLCVVEIIDAHFSQIFIPVFSDDYMCDFKLTVKLFQSISRLMNHTEFLKWRNNDIFKNFLRKFKHTIFFSLNRKRIISKIQNYTKNDIRFNEFFPCDNDTLCFELTATILGECRRVFDENIYYIESNYLLSVKFVIEMLLRYILFLESYIRFFTSAVRNLEGSYSDEDENPHYFTVYILKEVRYIMDHSTSRSFSDSDRAETDCSRAGSLLVMILSKLEDFKNQCNLEISDSSDQSIELISKIRNMILEQFHLIEKKFTQLYIQMENFLLECVVKNSTNKLFSIKSIPYVYRMTPKPPRLPSSYVDSLLREIYNFKEFVKSRKIISNEAILYDWYLKIVSSVSEAYSYEIRCLLRSSQQQEISLQQLKDSTDDKDSKNIIGSTSNVLSQLHLDVLYFIEECNRSLNISVKDSVDLQKLKNHVEDQIAEARANL